MEYEIENIPPESLEFYEQLGTKSKFWFAKETKLFKKGRPGTGENWAEVVASRICDLLRLPHAHYDFATYRETEGVVCNNIVHDGARLVHANELLKKAAVGNDYKNHIKNQHTLRRVKALFKNNQKYQMPLGFRSHSPEIKNALGVFIGYIMLDVLIANQDRHDENWGIVSDMSGFYLAKTYDHASSLGRELTDEKRQEKLCTRDKRADIKFYAGKGMSAFFQKKTGKARLSTIDAFTGIARMDVRAAKAWLDNLAYVTEESLHDICDTIPQHRMTELAKIFAIALILENKERLLHIREEL